MKVGSGNGDEVESRAAAWAIICAERELSHQEQQKLDSWLAESSRHLGAWVRAQAIWTDVDRVAALDKAASVPANEDQPSGRSRWPRFAMAASVALALFGGTFAYDRLDGRVSTGRSEVRTIALDDGSRIVLNGDSTVQIRYSEGARRVVLRRGEASFAVAHDTARPFLVTADDVTVRALGTRFAVGMDGEDVEVTVESGRVSVADGSAPPRVIRRNEEFVAAATGPRRAVLEPEEVARRLAWRRGLLIFDGQTLGRAASQVNRYSETDVHIDDPTLARAEFVGVFRIGDGRAFALAAAQAFNGEVSERADGLHLGRASNSPSH